MRKKERDPSKELLLRVLTGASIHRTINRINVDIDCTLYSLFGIFYISSFHYNSIALLSSLGEKENLFF